MTIGILKLEIHIPASNSLKHKRMILNSLKGKLRNKFNVSVAEIDGHDKWQRSTIAICQVNSQKKYIDQTMDKILNFAERFNGIDIINQDKEML